MTIVERLFKGFIGIGVAVLAIQLVSAKYLPAQDCAGLPGHSLIDPYFSGNNRPLVVWSAKVLMWLPDLYSKVVAGDMKVSDYLRGGLCVNPLLGIHCASGDFEAVVPVAWRSHEAVAARTYGPVIISARRASARCAVFSGARRHMGRSRVRLRAATGDGDSGPVHAGQLFAEWLGVLVWAVAMVIIGEGLRWPSDARSLLDAMQLVMWNRWTSREADRRSAMLGTGALAAAIIHSGLAIFVGPLGLFIWFAPTVWIGSQLPLVSELESGFWNAFTWTLVCGAQTAIVAWMSGLALGRARSSLGRRFGSR